MLFHIRSIYSTCIGGRYLKVRVVYSDRYDEMKIFDERGDHNVLKDCENL